MISRYVNRAAFFCSLVILVLLSTACSSVPSNERLREKYLQKVMRVLQAGSDEQIRNLLVIAGRYPVPEIKPLVADLTDFRDAITAAWALEYLQKVDPELAKEKLRPFVLKKSVVWPPLYDTLPAIARLFGQDALSMLERELKGDWCCSAADAIAEVGNREALEVLTREYAALEKENNVGKTNERFHLLGAMYRCGSREALTKLLEYLEGDTKYCALWVFDDMKPREEDRPLLSKRMNAIVTTPGDPYEKVCALQYLIREEKYDDPMRLIAFLQHKDYSVRQSALELLGKMNNSNATAALMSFLKNPIDKENPARMHLQAACALLECRPEDGFKAVVKLAESGLLDDSYEAMAISWLGEGPPGKVRELLLSNLAKNPYNKRTWMTASHLCKTASREDAHRIIENPATEWTPSLWYAIVYLLSEQPQGKPEDK